LNAIRSGRVSGDSGRVNGLILAGINRLSGFQHDDGMFAIWCGGKPGLDITGRVAHRLMALRELPYDPAHQMLDRAKEALLRKKFRDNQLLALDARFRAKLQTVKDAVALYFAGDGQRDKALDHLRKAAHHEGEMARWEGKIKWGYWGGHLEATCDATRVMYDAHHPLFRPGFNYVGSKLVNGMLYSTADTRALIELLAAIQADDEAVAVIDGQETRLDEQTIGGEVTALSDNLIVRVDEEVVIDHLAPRRDFDFEVAVKPRTLQLGQRTLVRVTLKEDSICPLARIYLPGCLALLKGGANAQTAHLPVGVSGRWRRDPRRLTLDVVAVRRGRGKLYVAVHDLYDADKVGTAPGVDITVK
jgi:hypothetical protein